MRGRIRTIKPDAFLDEKLWDLEQSTGLPIFRGYSGLWCYADKEGRFEWRPRALGAVILPYWNGDFASVLQALAGAGMLRTYEVSGRKYGSIPSFKKHQVLNNRETDSELPAPVDAGSDAGSDASLTREGKVQVEGNGNGNGMEDPPNPHSPPAGELVQFPNSKPTDPDDGQMPRQKAEAADVLKVFEFWQREHAHPTAKLDRKRQSRIKSRFRDGFSVRDLCLAIRGAKADRFMMGENPEGKVYDGLQTLLRDTEQVERLIGLTGKPRTPRSESPVDAEETAKRVALREANDAWHREQVRKHVEENPPTAEDEEFLRRVIGGKAR